MKRIVLGVLSLLFLSGCFEADFNFKTLIHRNGKVDREVQINGRGADRFLPPAGPQWEVKTSTTKGGQSILEDTHYHIHATGHFTDPSQFTSDFRYDVAKLISNLTEETRRELIEEVRVPGSLEQQIGAENQIELKRKRSLFTTEFDYTEAFHIRWLIPILLHDLQKEIIREQALTLKPQTSVSDVAGAPSGDKAKSETAATIVEPSLLSPEKIQALAQKKMREEILPKFQFHSEIILPGKVVSSNATSVHGSTAIWDFRGVDFENDFSVYTIRVISRAPNIGLIVASILGMLAVIWALAISSGRKKGRKGFVKPVT